MWGMKDRTLVALVSILVIGSLYRSGHNGDLLPILTIIIGYYFGKEDAI